MKAQQKMYRCPECIFECQSDQALNDHYYAKHVQVESQSIKIQSKHDAEADFKNFVVEPTITYEKLVDVLRQMHSIDDNSHFGIEQVDKNGVHHTLSNPSEWARALKRSRSMVLELSTSTSMLVEVLPLPTPVQSTEWKVHEIDLNTVEKGKEIGQGTSCKVYYGRWRGTPVAIKVLTIANVDQKEHEFNQEVGMMSRLKSHPSIVLLLGVCRDPMSLIFEYIPHTLFDLIVRPPASIPFP